jgi:hypothetical protein
MRVLDTEYPEQPIFNATLNNRKKSVWKPRKLFFERKVQVFRFDLLCKSFSSTDTSFQCLTVDWQIKIADGFSRVGSVWRCDYVFKCGFNIAIELAYSMEQNPSWEANSHSSGQEIPRLLCKPNVHYLSWIQSTNFHPTSLRSILMLSFSHNNNAIEGNPNSTFRTYKMHVVTEFHLSSCC